jgi:sec-independent protein translocase protein TatB
MFDIGFWEIAIIGVVALIVIGPDKLPAVARTVGFWLGKGRRFVATVQDDFNREVNKAEELKRLLEEQSKIKDMHEIIEQTVDDTKKSVSVGAQLDTGKTADNRPKHKNTEKLEAQHDQKQEDHSRAASTSSAHTTQTTDSKPTPTTTPPADHVNEQTK